MKGPPRQQPINEPTRYVITVANVGTGPALDVLIEADLPDKLTFVSAGDMGKHGGGKVGWRLGAIAAKDSRTVELVVRAREKGSFCFKTRAVFGPPKMESSTSVTETCTTFGVPAVLLEMYDREDPIPGERHHQLSHLGHEPGQHPVTNMPH